MELAASTGTVAEAAPPPTATTVVVMTIAAAPRSTCAVRLFLGPRHIRLAFVSLRSCGTTIEHRDPWCRFGVPTRSRNKLGTNLNPTEDNWGACVHAEAEGSLNHESRRCHPLSLPNKCDRRSSSGYFLSRRGMLGAVAQLSIRAESVDVLLFDLGGVVIDIDFRRCFQRWADASGRGIDHIASRFDFDTTYERHERGEMGIAALFPTVAACPGGGPERRRALGWLGGHLRRCHAGDRPAPRGCRHQISALRVHQQQPESSSRLVHPLRRRTSRCSRLRSCRRTSDSESLTALRSRRFPN